MPGTSREARITRWQVGLASAALAASLAWLIHAALFDPDVPFVTGGDPEWIAAVVPIHRNAIVVDPNAPPRTTFVRRFELDEVPGKATLAFRALGESEIRINERVVAERRGDRSRKRTIETDVAEALAPGANEIRATVVNPRGPALLQLRIEGVVDTDSPAAWQAIGERGRVQETTTARDVRVDPQALGLPGTGAVLVRRGAVFGLLFALGAVGFLALRRGVPQPLRDRAPEIVLAAGTLFALLVYALRSTTLPVLMGFDVVGHLAYIDHLLGQRALPSATDGGSMYHPPLGHAVIAAFTAMLDVSRDGAAGRWLYRLPTFLASLGNVWAVWVVARRLFEGSPLRIALSVGFAALLPMNLYMGAYVSNEPLHSFAVSASLALACSLMMASTTSTYRVAALGATLGLAILTKFTALVAVPIAAFFVTVKASVVERASALRALALGGGVLLGAALVGGWFYVRTWLLLGRPLVGNWDLPGGPLWWEQPGFHTPAYYTSFGQALSHPFFAGYVSFWDGVYSTFWGDGLVAGMLRLDTRHDAWSWEFMTATYWLAFPATVLLALGFVRAVRFALRGSDVGRRLAMSLLVSFLYVASFALCAIALQLPYYAQAKAFYLLSATVPISIAGGLGLAWVFERLRSPRWIVVHTIFTGWLATLAGSIVLSFLG